jgi:hypothetical protein
MALRVSPPLLLILLLAKMKLNDVGLAHTLSPRHSVCCEFSFKDYIKGYTYYVCVSAASTYICTDLCAAFFCIKIITLRLAALLGRVCDTFASVCSRFFLMVYIKCVSIVFLGAEEIDFSADPEGAPPPFIYYCGSNSGEIIHISDLL